MERKLASIQRIISVNAIDGADQIEKANVLGWELVIKKDEFKPGDLCVYMEVDSLVPERPEFEFLRPRGFRIRTVRLRKQVSQGIAFPLSILPDGGAGTAEVQDVTAALGVRKYEAPVPVSLSGQVKSGFPAFLKTTDETRIQSFPEVLARHRGKAFYVTEKLDGTSMTVYHRDGEFGVCSRNYDLIEEPKNTLWRVARELDLENKLKALGNIALQGELIGPGIQKNRYDLPRVDLYVFNVFDIDHYRYLDFQPFRRVVKDLDLRMVPVIEDRRALDGGVPDLAKWAQGPSLLNPSIHREGVVFRSLVEEQDPELGRLSFKVINPEFLLKYEE